MLNLSRDDGTEREIVNRFQVQTQDICLLCIRHVPPAVGVWLCHRSTSCEKPISCPYHCQLIMNTSDNTENKINRYRIEINIQIPIVLSSVAAQVSSGDNGAETLIHIGGILITDSVLQVQNGTDAAVFNSHAVHRKHIYYSRIYIRNSID